tara:strand:- start:1162 stop:1383 length:222 start_codon:yes stop_codon:yes gene_type:complete
MHYGDPNRNWRAPFARPDEPRELGPADARDIAHAGYEVRARRPRVAGYPDLVSPDRARTIEDTVREYDGFFDD